MKRLQNMLPALLAAGTLAVGSAFAAPTFVEGVGISGGWYDVNKKTKYINAMGSIPWQYYVGYEGFVMSEVVDTKLCWAAAASNSLQWWQDRKGNVPAGTPNGNARTAEIMPYMAQLQIYQTFTSSWYDYGGTVEQGWNWWFNGGTLANYGGSYKGNNNGGYWKDMGFTVDEANIASTRLFTSHTFPWDEAMTSLETCRAVITDYIDSGYGTTLTLRANNGEGGAHAITLWGYDYDNDNNLILLLTDSDDEAHGLFAKQLTFRTEVTAAGVTQYLLGLDNPTNYTADSSLLAASETLDYNADNSIVYSVHALTAPYAVAGGAEGIPEPATPALLLLAGSAALARRRRQA